MASNRRGRPRAQSANGTIAESGLPETERVTRVLARAARDLEASARSGRVRPGERATFQVVALLIREQRARVKTDAELTDNGRADGLRKLEDIGTTMARTAARDTTLLPLLTDNRPLTDAAQEVRAKLLRRAGIEAPEPMAAPAPEQTNSVSAAERKVVPVSVTKRQLSNPFLAPDYDRVVHPTPRARRLVGWELISPLLRSFEQASGGAPACMELPSPSMKRTPGHTLMRHQAQVVAAAEDGHRTFLLADEPGLGKTAQALLAAEAAGAYPLLVVVPNVVKANWAHEVEMWVPRRTATVVHGDGDTADGFADIVIVNYDILDRHAGWLATHGFRGMVIDEAHFIKNKRSQRSQHVLSLSKEISARMSRPLLIALTGTPLINDIEDFTAIWEFLGWIDGKEPTTELMNRLEDNALTPPEPGFYAAARQSVIDMGIVRRRKVDVAADIPSRRIADLPIELDEADGRSVREAEDALIARLLRRYDGAIAAREEAGQRAHGDFSIDHALIRSVATSAQNEKSEATEDNVFSLMRRIGQAKASLAADYAAQLARNVGKVVYFARHIDVMDIAQETFAKREIGFVSIRGDQTRAAREAAIEAFTNDPNVQIIVCSLLTAGVGINLQVSSNVVLAELSWTDAEQTQAIDRVHRIGQAEPVTAWRLIAAGTLDTHVAALIDQKAGLASRALDGSTEEVLDTADIRVEAMIALLTAALEARDTFAAHRIV